MSSRVYANGHIQNPVPLIKKKRGLEKGREKKREEKSPGGRFPPSPFIK